MICCIGHHKQLPQTQIFPNVSFCTNPSQAVIYQPIVTSQAFTIPVVARGKIGDTTETVVPVESRGTVFYCNPSAQTALYSNGTVTNSFQQNLLSINDPRFVPTMGPGAPIAPVSLTVQNIAQLIAASKKCHLPEWKVSQHNGDPLHWDEGFGQFKSAIYSANFSDDVRVTCLKMLVTGKTETAIAEFAYYGTMYQVARRTLER